MQPNKDRKQEVIAAQLQAQTRAAPSASAHHGLKPGVPASVMVFDRNSLPVKAP